VVVAGFMFTLVGMISFALVMPASAVADRFGRKWAIVPAGYIECIGLALVAATSAPWLHWHRPSPNPVSNGPIEAALASRRCKQEGTYCVLLE